MTIRETAPKHSKAKRLAALGAFGLALVGVGLSRYEETENRQAAKADQQQASQVYSRMQVDRARAEEATKSHHSADAEHLLGEVAILQSEGVALDGDSAEHLRHEHDFHNVTLFDLGGAGAILALLAIKQLWPPRVQP